MADTVPGNSQSLEAARQGDVPRRVVLLGASNIVRSMPIVVDSACKAWGSPLQILAATGHGRSYGMESRVLGRSLPGILQCGLWDALAALPSVSTAALITDIGNDILYGANAVTISNWIRACLQRLQPCTDVISVTRLPLQSVEALGEIRFVTMRTIVFPKSRLTLQRAVATARELDERLQHLAADYGAAVVEPEPHWYGLDPIHLKHKHQPAAWNKIFATWGLNAGAELAKHSLVRSWQLRSLRPQRQRFFGIEQRRQQPSRTLFDGSTLALY